MKGEVASACSEGGEHGCCGGFEGGEGRAEVDRLGMGTERGGICRAGLTFSTILFSQTTYST